MDDLKDTAKMFETMLGSQAESSKQTANLMAQMGQYMGTTIKDALNAMSPLRDIFRVSLSTDPNFVYFKTYWDYDEDWDWVVSDYKDPDWHVTATLRGKWVHDPNLVAFYPDLLIR